ncbi:MAG TPA: YbdD/YjiX family protein [Candidatus Acidoferrales bacterium]|nr:YbdD/YjiX family protein [Candidatus Acidoferrales bacterium]
MTARRSNAGLLKRAWSWLRQVTGDAAYDNYLRHAVRTTEGKQSLTRAEFYRESLRRRYSTISRCC